MIIGGLQKFSLLDYPDHIAAIIFTQGCNFRCQFCYNPMLVKPASHTQERFERKGKISNIGASNDGQDQKCHPLISEDDIFAFLRKRKGKLDAVVITGGEPTLHQDLPEFIQRIRKLDYKIKLDTNGTNPKMLKDLISRQLIDYIAMDIKGPVDKYGIVTGVNADLNKIKESITIIMKSGLPYEFRTTVVPDLIVLADIHSIGKLIKGADKWYLQVFKSDIDLVNLDFKNTKSYSDSEMKEMELLAKKYVKFCAVR